VLFFVLAYLFTWMFWIPAIFVPGNPGAVLMLIGLLAPAVVSTMFVLMSKSELLADEQGDVLRDGPCRQAVRDEVRRVITSAV
jgi:hypothetical protein